MFHGEICQVIGVPGTQSLPVLNVGAHQGGFGNYFRRYVIADKGYNYIAVRTPIRKAEKIPVIPRRAYAIFPGLQDIYKPYYRTRSAIERFFGRIKENKRLALRFEKLDHTFFSFFA